MDKRDADVWAAFVRVEKSYSAALAELWKTDLVAVLRGGLRSLSTRRPALLVLGMADVKVGEQLLPDLLKLANVSHSLIDEVRRCILRIPLEMLRPHVARHVEGVIVDARSDYEAYRRTAELLVQVEEWELLGVLVGAATQSSDPDIHEVAEDFEGIYLERRAG